MVADSYNDVDSASDANARPLSSCSGYSGSESVASGSMRFAFWLPSDSQSQVSRSSAASDSRPTETSSQCSFTSCLSSRAKSTVSAMSNLSRGQSVEDASREQVLLDASLCSQLVRDLHEETGMSVTDLFELDQAGILEQIPRNDEGEISSVGSMKKHMDGTCAPCIFWFNGHCPKLLKCSFCHFRHPGQKAKRYKSNKRTRAILRGMKEPQDDATE